MSRLNTGFKDGATGRDIAEPLVDKAYLIDRYPELADTFRFAGLWTFGSSSNGQLGDNTTTNKSSPVQTIAAGTNWKQVSAGGLYATAIKTDGTLWSWGSGTSGELGNNTAQFRSSPVQTIAGGTNWKQVSAGDRHSAAIKTDGTLWLWGYNLWGQLGDNTTVPRSSPIQTIAGGTNWKQVAQGYASAHTAAIKTDGTLWLWGRNDDGSAGSGGQLGDNTTTGKSSPVQTIAGGTNWKQVACGQYHTAAIKTDGTLWTWGDNSNSQLGNGSFTDRSSPVQTIAAGTNWKQVSCGNYHSAAIKTDGTLWLWGQNYYGQHGSNTTGLGTSAVQTISGGTNWKFVACTGNGTAAIKTDGTLWLWGSGTLGKLGNNTTSNRSSPIQTISSGTNWKDVSGSLLTTMAIRDDSGDLI